MKSRLVAQEVTAHFAEVEVCGEAEGRYFVGPGSCQVSARGCCCPRGTGSCWEMPVGRLQGMAADSALKYLVISSYPHIFSLFLGEVLPFVVIRRTTTILSPAQAQQTPVFLWSRCCLSSVSGISVQWFVVWTKRSALCDSVQQVEAAALGFENCSWHYLLAVVCLGPTAV